MAESVHLYLKANGNDVQGESTQTSLGRENSIECLSFESRVLTAREASSGMATGRRQYQPLVIRKRIDKSSPVLMKALALNEVVDGTFKFFRPNPSGDGTTEQFYTVEIKQGRISDIRLFVPDVLVPAASAMPPMEEVSFVFHTISWKYTKGGAGHVDTWNEPR